VTAFEAPSSSRAPLTANSVVVHSSLQDTSQQQLLPSQLNASPRLKVNSYEATRPITSRAPLTARSVVVHSASQDTLQRRLLPSLINALPRSKVNSYESARPVISYRPTPLITSHNMASPQEATLMGLPKEILNIFLPFELASRSGTDLKQFRLMNKKLSEFVEPFLFRWICLSKAEENFTVWKAITDPNNRLRHHVEHICMDSTWFIPKITKAEYCVRLAQHIKEIDSEISSAQGGMAQIYTRRNLSTNLHYKKQGKNLPPGDRHLVERL
jgi:hypothetical protein